MTERTENWIWVLALILPLWLIAGSAVYIAYCNWVFEQAPPSIGGTLIVPVPEQGDRT